MLSETPIIYTSVCVHQFKFHKFCASASTIRRHTGDLLLLKLNIMPHRKIFFKINHVKLFPLNSFRSYRVRCCCFIFFPLHTKMARTHCYRERNFLLPVAFISRSQNSLKLNKLKLCRKFISTPFLHWFFLVCFTVDQMTNCVVCLLPEKRLVCGEPSCIKWKREKRKSNYGNSTLNYNFIPVHVWISYVLSLAIKH